MKKQERLFIKRLIDKKVDGGVHMYLVVIFFIMIILLVFRFMYDSKRIEVTADAVDDSVTEALVSAATYNSAEYQRSTSSVIFRKVSETRFDSVVDDLLGFSVPVDASSTLTDSAEILDVNGDEYLKNAYNQFESNLKKNLMLSGLMDSTISGIRGKVDIDEFVVFNKYYDLDALGNRTHFRFVRYTKRGTSNWEVSPFPVDSYPSYYSTKDKANIKLNETSIACKLRFDMVISETSEIINTTLNDSDTGKTVEYSRVVDITDL